MVTHNSPDTDSAALMARIPGVDRLLAGPNFEVLQRSFGRTLVVDAARERTEALRARLREHGAEAFPEDLDTWMLEQVRQRIETLLSPSLKRVLNLTGTVLHTNLGRAPLPEEALQAMREVAGACNVELDLDSGKRGDRDSHIERWLQRLIGCEAATVVNNNAAAVLLVLNTLALRKQVPVSRGELIEIGGAFRMPDVMSRAGCKLVEVGTTNRTHPRDFENAINAGTAMLMKVHPSNFEVCGFAGTVDEQTMSEIAHHHGLPMVYDLGSGAFLDLTPYGVPREPMPAPALAAGVDLVTFSGDKLLGGPQCGIIAGRKSLVDRIKKNPLKRSLRLDKLMLAALEAVLRLYANPDDVISRLPALRMLTRDQGDIRSMAQSLRDAVVKRVPVDVAVRVEDCASQIGSGALPISTLPSSALVLTPQARGRGRSRALRSLSAWLRDRPLPVIGRVHEDELWLDLRCLERAEDLLEALDTRVA
ncbi:MAG: L-seryl-tRNA(Sec) selenium transferase [Gammaproteobacteria bacterium]|nr:L-seryl-tRNA(Sec) selenium transferase [Gammaproteobacteria bacterium]